MTRMRVDRHPSSSEHNKEDKEGGGNLGSLPSRPEQEGVGRQGSRQPRSAKEDLAHKSRLNRQQADDIGNPGVDESGNQKPQPGTT